MKSHAPFLLNRRSLLLSATSLLVGRAQTGPRAPWQEQGVIDTSRSPFAKLTPVPLHAIHLGDGFWRRRMLLNSEKGLPVHVEDHERSGVMDNFRRLTGKQVERKSFLWSDEYLYKLMEAMAFVLQTQDDAAMRRKLEELVDMVIAAQQPDGYLNTYWVEERAAKRLSWMQGSHELYCFGHMLQAAIAYYRATGNRRFIDAGLRYFDLLAANYGRDKKPLTDGHPEAEMALIELYRTTGDRRALDFAGYLLQGDGARLGWTPEDFVNLFAGKPFTDRTKLEGHAVRCMYACCGAADYYAETGNASYLETLERLWQELVGSKMYITGGVGSRRDGEAFGEPFELPNRGAWCESCAAIGNMMWQYRLLQIRAEGRFADVMERIMYNGMNAGYGVSGTSYCYRNPLELTAVKHRHSGAMCCSPNLNRTIASIPGYFYSTSKDGIYVHLFHDSVLDWRLADGTALKIAQRTEYPWKGWIEFSVEPAVPVDFAFYVRVPAWSRTSTIKVNGKPAEDVTPGEYICLRRNWKSGDRVHLELNMDAHIVTADPRVEEDRGRVAVQRGPLVYALEHLDQPDVQDFQSASLSLNRSTPDQGFEIEARPDLLGGVSVLKHKGTRAPSSGRQKLYTLASEVKPPATEPVQLTLIPFYTYANREPSEMQVWIPCCFE